MDKKVLKYMVIFLVLCLNAGCAKMEKPGGVVLRFENWEVTPEQLRLWTEVTDKFNESHKGKIMVKFESVHGGPDKILIEIAAGSAPDIFFSGAPDLLAPLVEKKAVLDLTPYLEATDEIKESDYYPWTWEAIKFDSGIYGLPCYWGDLAIAYNKDIFEKAGVKYVWEDKDWTSDDFLEVAKSLTIKKDGKIVQYGCSSLSCFDLVWLFGGYYFDKDGNCLLDSPQARKALEYFQELTYKYGVAPSPSALDTTGDAGLGTAYRSAMELFMGGKVGMYPTFSWMVSVLKEIKGFRWDFAPRPKFGGVKRLTGEGSGILCISSQSKYPKEAFEFVKYACGEQGLSVLGQGGNCIPAMTNVAEKALIPPPENIKIFITQIEGVDPAFSPSRFIWWREWFTSVWTPVMDNFALNKISVEEAVKQVTKNTEKFLKTQDRNSQR